MEPRTKEKLWVAAFKLGFSGREDGKMERQGVMSGEKIMVQFYLLSLLLHTYFTPPIVFELLFLVEKLS